MAAPIAGFTGIPYYGAVPLEVQFTDLSTGLPTSWLWTFGDGATGAEQSPLHTYTDVGAYSVVLDATNLDGTGSATGAVSAYRLVSFSTSPAVNIVSPSIKYCSSFTCLGWIKNLSFGPSGNSLIPLAVSDSGGDVRGSASAMYFEIVSDTGDYRLAFMGSKSVLIASSTGVDLADGRWHMLAWVGDDTGAVTHYVDGIPCPVQSGVGADGVLYSKPHTTAPRTGGGYVWVPHLDESGQALAIFNWRYASGLVIHGDWVRELMVVDRGVLGI
jgi:PKD repeat protein